MELTKRSKEIIKNITLLRKRQKEEIIYSLISPLNKMIDLEKKLLSNQISLEHYVNEQDKFSKYIKEYLKR